MSSPPDTPDEKLTEAFDALRLHGEAFGTNVFVFRGPLTRLDREALMRFEAWTFWQHQWWRVRKRWARMRGTDT